MKPKPLADVLTDLAGNETIDRCVREAVNDALADYTDIENDGIGKHEYQGQICWDNGRDYTAFTGLTLAVNVTDDAEAQKSEDSVTGRGYVSNGEGELPVDWSASFTKKAEQNGKVYLIFNVEQRS